MANHTSTSNEVRNRLLFFFVGFWLPSVTSVVLNSFIVAVSLKKNVIKGGFKLFVAHLAIADLTVSVSIVFLQPVIVLGKPNIYWSWACDIAGTIHWMGMQTMILALALLAYNRYVSICKGEAMYKSIFTKQNTALMFGMTQSFCAAIGSSFWIDTFYYGSHALPQAGTVCIGYIKIDSALIRMGTDLSGLVSMAALAATIYFVYCTKRKIEQHSMEVREIVNEQKFIRNQNIVKALTIQLYLALLAIFPPVVVAIIPAVTGHLFTPVDAQVFMVYNPAFDAIATLLVAAPYRRVGVNWIKQLRHGKFLLKDPKNKQVPPNRGQGKAKI